MSVKHSPQGDFYSQISVDGNRKKTKYWTLSQYQNKTRQEKTSIKVWAQTNANSDGKGDGKTANQNICHG